MLENISCYNDGYFCLPYSCETASEQGRPLLSKSNKYFSDLPPRSLLLVATELLDVSSIWMFPLFQHLPLPSIPPPSGSLNLSPAISGLVYLEVTQFHP